ncbi:Ca-activated chloride channel family protein [Sporosarcina luteola]|nr:Ca-activated chloride channel family protein [Sporosarcina luteola]
MKVKTGAIIAAFCLMATGCSAGEKTEVDQSASGKESEVVDKEIVDKKESGPSSEESEMDISNQMGEAATTPEELAQFPPGQLTKEFSVDRETSMWIGKKVHEDIQEDFLNEMESILESTNDPEDLYAVFLHVLGGAQYHEVVQPLIDYAPDFKEPILPEPYEMTTEGAPAAIPEKAIILLDASSSMLLQADGKLKMDTAKRAVKGFAATIGSESDMSLYVYGHAGTQNKSDKSLSCSTIDEMYPLGEYKEKEFDNAVDSVTASGWTPLAGAIKQARLDHEQTGEDLTLYIVSDGAETCDGNPVEEARAFAELSKDRHVNVIGFQVDQTAESQLKEVAEAGNGTYLSANSLEEMTEGIAKLWLPSDLDLVGLMYFQADAWPKTMARDKVGKLASLANDQIRVESDRFEGAAYLLERKKMIEPSTKEELLAIAERHREQYKQLVEELKEEKYTLIQDELDRIDKKIDEYRERMMKLKKEQGK